MFAGCIEYLLCQDNDDPAVFVFYENWESAAARERLKDTDHDKHYSATVFDKIEERIVNKLTKIG